MSLVLVPYGREGPVIIKISDLGVPVFGHVLLNGMFAVSDWEKRCVSIIGKSSNIEIMKFNGSKPGSISSDSNNTLYGCDFQ